MNATDYRSTHCRLSLEPGEDQVLALGLAYLKTGMSPEDAIDAAIADFACTLEDEVICRY